ncbi:MAG TPA: hypothetical protein VES42_27000, partial [Pilimelia sp.]|nr:hypothetical protein [Pilimelia sp.]
MTEERTVDEAGQPGDAVAGENGNGAGPRGEPPRSNGLWATTEGWSNAGAALEPAAEPVAPAWRQPADLPIHRAWSPSVSRYADLLPGSADLQRYEPPRAQHAHTDEPPAQPTYREPPYPSYPTGLYPAATQGEPPPRVPASAPPYPYEGDLEDIAGQPPPRQWERDRPRIPAER